MAAEMNEAEDRVKSKMAKLQDVVEQTVQLKRLIKRNMKIEKSIKKRFWSQNMDVSFENQRCTIPFILVKMQMIPGDEMPVEHDGSSKIRMNSSQPIQCLGDVQVMNFIYPPEKARQTTSERESKVRRYMPFDDYQRV